MDGRWLLRGVGAWLAFALGTGIALALVWSPMRSLYYPGTGSGLGFDAGIGLLLSAGLFYGGYRAHRELEDRGHGPVSVAWIVGGAALLGAPLGIFFASFAESVARSSTGFLDGLEYVLLFLVGAMWVAGCLLVLALRWRTWRAYWTAVSLTAAGVGFTGALFSLYLIASAQRLRALAEARNRNVPGAELLLVLGAVALLALARRRR